MKKFKGFLFFFKQRLCISSQKLSNENKQPLQTVYFDWYLSGLEWIVNLEFWI